MPQPAERAIEDWIKSVPPAEGPRTSVCSQTIGLSLIQPPDITLNHARYATPWEIPSSFIIRMRPWRHSCPVTPHLI